MAKRSVSEMAAWCGLDHEKHKFRLGAFVVFTLDRYPGRYYVPLNNSSLHLDEELVENSSFKTVVDATTSSWRESLDIALVAILAIFALVANLGLVYLARKTKSAQRANTSFSISSPVSQFISSNCVRTSTKQLWFREKFAKHAMASPQPPVTNCPTTLGLLQKCASSISLSRINHSVFAFNPFRTSNNPHPRGRRHQRYLRGLLALSIGNITVAISLGFWCAGQLVERKKSISWMPIVRLTNHALADVAQCVEIGAILWIALERTLGIHWPRERRTSVSTEEQLRCGSRNAVGAVLNGDEGNFTCWKVRPRCATQWRHRRWSLTPNHFSNLCMTSKFRAVIRLLISLLPLCLFVTAFLPCYVTLFAHKMNGNTTELVRGNSYSTVNSTSNNTTPAFPYPYLIYYTNSMVFALIIGQFLAPLSVLVTTNLLIYKKVASRDKHFFSRQSSSTSKSSCVSTTSNPPNNRSKSKNSRNAVNPKSKGTRIPVLRVLESSTQDVRDDRSDSKIPNEPMEEALERKVEDKPTLLKVPDFTGDGDAYPKSFLCKKSLPARRMSTSAVWTDSSTSPFGSHSSSMATGLDDAHKLEFCSPPARRKSTNDILGSLFTTRGASELNGRMSEEPLLLQMLRRQHHRTLRILIILLLVFVLCRAPRAIILVLGWLQAPSVCASGHLASTWLHYTTLWAETSAVLDAIVYGFWGNRAYRMHLKTWCQSKLRCLRKSVRTQT